MQPHRVAGDAPTYMSLAPAPKRGLFMYSETMISLVDLNAQFLKHRTYSYEYEGDVTDVQVNHPVDTLAEATGITFKCPKCFKPDGGGHYVICWFTGVPCDVSPGPGRWNPAGTGLSDLTFVPPGAVSVLLKGGCGWHGHVRNGCVG